MSQIKIDFNKAVLSGQETKYVTEAFVNSHISGDGPFTKKCQALLEQDLNVPKALLTTNCTHSLEMAAILLDIQPGDEVIFPSFTFVSTINAFVLRGAHPVFIDVKQDTLNIDETLIERSITNKTRAIVVVHYAGVGCNMSAILPLAAKHNLQVIEDNAHGLFGKFQGQYLGTFGSMATQSFHETKNITCGEGGAILINNKDFIERAEIIREKGTNRSRFFRGMVDKYTWVDIGSSYLPSDILAAVLLAQLENWRAIQAYRKTVWEHYFAGLKNWARENLIQLPYIPPDCEQAYHMFYMVMPNLDDRQRLMQHLRTHDIVTVFHYQPLHLSGMGRKFGGKSGDFPITEMLGDCLIRLPFYNNLTPDDQDIVIKAIQSCKFK